MIHTENNTNGPADTLQSLLKVLSMLNMRIWYEKNNVDKNVPDALVIEYINRGKVVGCTLEKLPIEDIITVFHKCGVSACWFILYH